MRFKEFKLDELAVQDLIKTISGKTSDPIGDLGWGLTGKSQTADSDDTASSSDDTASSSAPGTSADNGDSDTPSKIVVVGDSLAVGTGGQIPGAIVDAKVGINSKAVLDKASSNKNLKGADLAIISAGANDGAGINGKNPDSQQTISNLKAIRTALGAKKYVWILPYNRSVANDISSAAERGDEFVDLANTVQVSKDNLHPSSYGPVAKAALSKGGIKDTGYSKAGAGLAATGSAKEALQFFIGKGWTKEQAAGIVGNLQAESGKDLRTNAVGDGGQAYGIAQWHPDRQAKFKRAFGKDIHQSNFQEQLAFVQWELEHDESAAASQIKNAKTAKQAAAAMDQYYERSSGSARQTRIAYANNLAGTATA